MKKIISVWKIILSLFLPAFLFSACKDEPTDLPTENSSDESTVLIYAIATNSLSSNLIYDKNEILKAAPEIDLTKNNVLIYETTYNFVPRLIALKHTEDIDNPYIFEVIKEFDSDISSANPTRISEVINYVLDNYTSEQYGMIFWSHSTGSAPWLPTVSSNGTTSTRQSLESEPIPSVFSFGQDKNSPDSESQQINVDVLASVIPNDVFNFIWFDSCYMSNIESIYEFRGKCNYYIGYPTEVMDEGSPYDLILPYIAKKDPELKKAAEIFFDFYDTTYYYRFATVAIVDMNKIELLAELCSRAYTYGVTLSPASYYKYTRGSTGPFYELWDYTKAMAKESGFEISEEEWNATLDEVIIYRAATPKDLTNTEIPADRFSGISTHVYNFDITNSNEHYYKNYLWYKKVFE